MSDTHQPSLIDVAPNFGGDDSCIESERVLSAIANLQHEHELLRLPQPATGGISAVSNSGRHTATVAQNRRIDRRIRTNHIHPSLEVAHIITP